MSEVEWKDPPKGRGPSGAYVAIFDELRTRPGEWAFIGRRAVGVPTSIKQGRMKGCEAGEFEAVGRNQQDGQQDVYVRYIGKADLKVAAS